MTRIPHPNRDVHGLSGDLYPSYKVGPLCCHPNCSKPADHKHHLWPRSFTAGPFDWVELWDGRIIGNCVGICWRHHQAITENRDAIRLLDNSFVYVEEGEIIGELKNGPPGHGQPLSASETIKGPGFIEKCPGCGRPLPHEHDKKEPRRRRKSWVIQVPDDREDGAVVLDLLVDGVRELFGHDTNRNTRYFTIAQALALILQNKDSLVKSDNPDL